MDGYGPGLPRNTAPIVGDLSDFTDPLGMNGAQWSGFPQQDLLYPNVSFHSMQTSTAPTAPAASLPQNQDSSFSLPNPFSQFQRTNACLREFGDFLDRSVQITGFTEKEFILAIQEQYQARFAAAATSNAPCTTCANDGPRIPEACHLGLEATEPADVVGYVRIARSRQTCVSSNQNKGGYIPCPRCRVLFSSGISLKRHLAHREPSEVWKCIYENECSSIFHRDDALRDHYRKQHGLGTTISLHKFCLTQRYVFSWYGVCPYNGCTHESTDFEDMYGIHYPGHFSTEKGKKRPRQGNDKPGPHRRDPDNDDNDDDDDNDNGHDDDHNQRPRGAKRSRVSRDGTSSQSFTFQYGNEDGSNFTAYPAAEGDAREPKDGDLVGRDDTNLSKVVFTFPEKDFPQSLSSSNLQVRLLSYLRGCNVRSCRSQKEQISSGGTYQCLRMYKRCSARFQSKMEWLRHINYHDPATLFSCHYWTACGSISERLEKVFKHIKQAHPGAATDDAISHSSHPIQVSRNRTCGFCGDQFQNWSQFWSVHVAKHLEDDPSGSKQWRPDYWEQVHAEEAGSPNDSLALQTENEELEQSSNVSPDDISAVKTVKLPGSNHSERSKTPSFKSLTPHEDQIGEIYTRQKHSVRPDLNQWNLGRPAPLKLFKLYPAPGPDAENGIRLVGEVIFRQEGQEYEVLSYYRDNTTTRTVDIGVQGEVLKITISESLYEALIQLRTSIGSSEERIIWIDAFCMNPANPAERLREAMRMQEVFESATKTCIWLGDSDSNTDKVLPLIQDIARLRHAKLSETDEDADSEQWVAFFRLLKRPWFRRLWTVQEMAWARKATFHCGHLEGDWRDLAEAIELVDIWALRFHHEPVGRVEELHAYRLVKLLSTVFLKADNGQKLVKLLSLETLVTRLAGFESDDPHDAVFAVWSLAHDAEKRFARQGGSSAQQFVNSDDFSKLQTTTSDSTGKVSRPSTPREKNLQRVKQPAATSPETPKRSFGIQTPPDSFNARSVEKTVKTLDQTPQMQSETKLNGLEPRKSSKFRKLFDESGEERKPVSTSENASSVLELYQCFVYLCILWSGSLNILFRPWALCREDTLASNLRLPSWICPSSKSAFLSSPEGYFERASADSLVGFPDEKPLFNASGLSRVVNDFGDVDFEFRGEASAPILAAPGFILDTVGALQAPALEAKIPREWLKFSGWYNVETSPPESFVRTLVADRDVEGRNAPSYFSRACHKIFKSRLWAMGSSLDEIAEMEEDGYVREYLSRVRAVVWNRCLFRTSTNLFDQMNGLRTIGRADALPGSTPPVGTLGLGPQTMRKGDLVCILQGCSVPVILRPHGEPATTVPTSGRLSQDGDSSLQPAAHAGKARLRCSIVGECYVHNMMNGEALEVMTKRTEAERKELIFEMV